MKLTGLFYTIIVFVAIVFGCTSNSNVNDIDEVKSHFESKEFQFDNVTGIGYEKGCTRRDNSDIIQVGGKHYVYYTKVYGRSPGYWGTIWSAYSEDNGYSWTEIGEVLGSGEKGQWDSQAVFTPNIIKVDNTYYLYYTGVMPTPTNEEGLFENNSVNDYTAIGVAESKNPEGPFVRCSDDPILTVSSDHDQFDSYRVDDAVLLKQGKEYWLYYKGRRYADGKQGPAHTQMGIAISKSPLGPFVKHDNNPILDKSHEVFLWEQNQGVACLASISCTFEYATDRIDFTSNPLSVKIDRDKRPNAPGAFRPELTGGKSLKELSWGISMIHNGDEAYLVRWEHLFKDD